MASRRGNGEGTIYERPDGTWAAQLSLGYDENGKRKRRMVYGKTKKEVQDKLTKLQSAKLDGTLTEPTRVTVAEYLDRWLDDSVKLTTRGNTYGDYKSVVNCHVKPQIGGIGITKLTPIHVQGFYSELARKGMSARRRQIVHAVLHRALKQAVKWGLVPRNVCDAVDPPRVPRKTIVPLKPEQVTALLKAAEDDRLYALYVLAVTGGMRQGELLALQWPDIDFDAKMVSIRHTLIEVQGKVEISEPKTDKSRRRVSIPQIAVDALIARRKQAVAEGHAASPWVFCDSQGGFLRKSNLVNRSFKPLLKAAELPPIRFHDLRHTSATLLLLQGVHAKVVQERLGHSTIGMTLDTYSHVLPALESQAADKFDSLLGKKTA